MTKTETKTARAVAAMTTTPTAATSPIMPAAETGMNHPGTVGAAGGKMTVAPPAAGTTERKTAHETGTAIETAMIQIEIGDVEVEIAIEMAGDMILIGDMIAAIKTGIGIVRRRGD